MPRVDERTEPMPLDGDRRHHRKLVRFDPTISSGSIATIITLLVALLGAYGKYESDRATTSKSIDQIEKDAASQKLEMREAIRDLRLEMRGVQTTITSVDKTVTGIKAEIDASRKGKQ